MLIVESKVSREDQAIEKYYYYLFSKDKPAEVKRRAVYIFIVYILIALAYFLEEGMSLYIVLFFIPAFVPLYLISPWLAWRYGVGGRYKFEYKEVKRTLTVYSHIIVFLDAGEGGFSEKVNVEKYQLYKVLYNPVHFIFFYEGGVHLINVLHLDDNERSNLKEFIKNSYPSCEVGEVKVKEDIF